MQNLTDLPGNAINSQKSLSVIIKVCVVIPFFCIFLYCIVVMVHTVASHRQFLDNSRYILFAYMLINDTLQLLSSVLLFLFIVGNVKFAIVYCAPLLFFSTSTFHNTPLILAAMSLERYVAIFYPLQRPAAWHADRIWIIILSLWLVSCILPIVDFSLGKPQPGVNVLSTPVVCRTMVLNSSPVQTLYKMSLNGLFFAVVLAIIMFTYMRILLETRKMRQDRASVAKAMHTVLLHGFQLLLCMISFTQPVTESLISVYAGLLAEHISFFIYFCFILLPRFLSPLIYGLRDESLRCYVMRDVLCCSHKHRFSVKVRVSPRAPATTQTLGQGQPQSPGHHTDTG
ncbi:odorant receptor 131-2-like [Oncorhynchus kisutch]|uniref:Odorant receptor, family 95, subfamily A, member 1 n=1 Tax=Oncorhynchus kisutch TaxID=8019 RepID=A0A8C7HWT5_ONCKI|nr:odorant receptor 131-2-like [Oncorhynchus kisutch]